jgi:hypothetical protein
MVHVVAMKCLIGLPLLKHIEILRRSRSRSFKNRGAGVGVGTFVYRLHSPAQRFLNSATDADVVSCTPRSLTWNEDGCAAEPMVRIQMPQIKSGITSITLSYNKLTLRANFMTYTDLIQQSPYSKDGNVYFN